MYMMFPAVCSSCLFRCFAVAPVLIGISTARAQLFTCESVSGGVLATATVLFAHPFGEFEIDDDRGGDTVVGCNGGRAFVSAAASGGDVAVTGQSTLLISVDGSGIELSGNSSGTGASTVESNVGFFGGGGGIASAFASLRIHQRVIATVRISTTARESDTFSLGVQGAATQPNIPHDTAGIWTFPICPINESALLSIHTQGRQSYHVSVTFVPARSDDCFQVGLRALEVTQSIQDWSNSIPLIEKKPTFVRAHLQAFNDADVSRQVTAKLRGFRNGSELPGSPLSPVSDFPFVDPAELARDAAVQRNQTFVVANNSTLNFALPESWRSGTIRLHLDAPDFLLTPLDPAEPGGAPRDGAVTVNFTPMTRPVVVFSTIRVIRADGSTGPAPLADDIRDAILTAWSMYPVDKFTLRSGQPLYVDLRSSVGLNAQLNAVVGSRNFGIGPLGTSLGIGIVSDADFPAGFDTKGEAQPALGVAWATTSRDTLAHELGHLLGRPHTSLEAFNRTTVDGFLVKRGSCCELAPPLAPDFPYYYAIADTTPGYGCGVSTDLRPSLGPLDLGENAKIYGLHRLQNTFNTPLSPSNTFELMSYCGTATKWISSETYQGLMSAIRNRWGSSPAATPTPLAMAQAAAPSFIIRGFVNLTADTVELLPLQKLSNGPSFVPTPAGVYTVRTLDAANAVLAETTFAALLPDDFQNIDDHRAPFIVALPFNAAATRIEVRHAGAPKAALSASAHPPAIQLLFPNGGDNLDGDTVNIRWQATDEDAEPLSFSVDYSSDDGATWNSLGVDLRGTNLLVDLPELAGSPAARFRVIAADGFHSTADESDAAFAVRDRGPDIFIRLPAEGARFYASQSLLLHGFALDKEDGEVNNLEWRSDVSGLLGRGEEVLVKAHRLPEGPHRISLIARDSAGATSSATNTIFIHRAMPPRLKVRNINAGRANLEVGGTVPSRTIIETSSNLVDWLPSQVFTQAYRVEFREDVSTGARRFFRARAESLPLPGEASPQVLLQAPNATTLAGGTIHLSVLATGEAPLSYQWLRNGVPIPGAIDSLLQLTNVQLSASGQYSLIISNDTGVTVSSNVLVTVLSSAFQTLHRFGPSAQNGINGWGTLALGSDGALYGCVRNGGASNAGAIFRLETTGSNYTILHHFTGGAGGTTPLGGIIEGSDGALYGTTFSGGTNNSGVIFRINKSGSDFTVLHHFLSISDCRNPQAELLEASDGLLYGTAYNGGGFARGGIFKINKDGSGYTIVSGLNFGGAEAPRQPIGGLIEAQDGFLYGTSESGGATTNGTVFRVNKNGTNAVVLKSLGIVDGGVEQPNGTLALGDDGQLYGTAAFGGSANFGGVFRMATNGTNFAVIKSFAGADAREPRAGLVKARGGVLIGTSRIGGEVDTGALFQIRPDSDYLYVHLRNFSPLNGNGVRPRGPVIYADGFCYGTTFGGGTNDQGTIFRHWLGE